MIIRISPTARLHVRRPLWVERSRPPQLELSLPATVRDVAVSPVPQGYRLRVLAASDESALVTLLQRAGFGFDVKALEAALSVCVPRGCFIIEHLSTGALSATTMARHVASPVHPFGGRIDWLATHPDHRGRGLATICARSAARRLRESGYDDIWATTDDHRIGALKVFLSIGFQPDRAPSTELRWRHVLQAVAAPVASADSPLQRRARQ